MEAFADHITARVECRLHHLVEHLPAGGQEEQGFGGRVDPQFGVQEQLTDALADARANNYAVPAFDCTEDIMVRTILETAEDLRSPVILMCLQMHLEGNGTAYLSGLIRAVADHHKIPIVLHLDHAANLGEIRNAIDADFTSVMIDGSRLPFDENAALTAEAVKMAAPKGISVEGEVGHVGGNKPVPVKDEEIAGINQQMTEGATKPKPKISFDQGESIRVIGGPFSNFTGIVEEVRPDKQKVRVLVSIFGRATPVEVDFMQVEKA